MCQLKKQSTFGQLLRENLPRCDSRFNEGIHHPNAARRSLLLDHVQMILYHIIIVYFIKWHVVHYSGTLEA